MLTTENSTASRCCWFFLGKIFTQTLGSFPSFTATDINLHKVLFLNDDNNLLTVLRDPMLISQLYFTHIAIMDLQRWAKKFFPWKFYNLMKKGARDIIEL